VHIDPPIVTNLTATGGPRTGLGDTQIYNFTFGKFDDAQPSLYRSGVGAPKYQIFTGIALQLPPRFTNSWHRF
jgi:hypothetical protein